MPERTPKILGTGLVALDLVVSSDPETPIRSWAGGTCGNVLSILAWLGWDAYPIARMNEDAASTRVRADLERWGVHLDLSGCGPAVHTPIIVQEIRQSSKGGSTHRFSWSCLRCGGWLPSFKPVTRAVVDRVAPHVPGTSVFFFDRVSRGALDMAAAAAAEGAVVMFEPSGRGDEKQFIEALAVSHIVKYADQRLAALVGDGSPTNLRLEIQTLGSDGLRFRLPRDGRNPNWRGMKAVVAETLTDSCGSGDWCTAGVLATLATGGITMLDQATVPMVVDALSYGQELAAWNCRFEGARGGMYAAPEKVPGTVGPRSLRPARMSVNPLDEDSASALVGCPRCDAA